MSETTKNALWRVAPWLILVGLAWAWASSSGNV